MTPKERTNQYLNMITDKNGDIWISAHKLEVMLNNIQNEACTEVLAKIHSDKPQDEWTQTLRGEGEG